MFVKSLGVLNISWTPHRGNKEHAEPNGYNVLKYTHKAFIKANVSPKSTRDFPHSVYGNEMTKGHKISVDQNISLCTFTGRKQK